MLKLKKIIIAVFFSQILILWVFWLEKNEYYVIDAQKNLCWLFTRGNAQNPNWLPENWSWVFLYPDIGKKFETNPSCKNGQVSICCQELWYKSFNTSVGQKSIDEWRFAAEFLSSKKIILAQSFSPSQYELENFITRKEFMKVVLNASGKKVIDRCTKIFWDVSSDWWCKYIESALEYDFIESNLRFRPNENVTKVEALKLIFQARNIEKRYSTLYWQEDYISSAYYLWYIDEKFKDYNSFASRTWIFQVLARSYPEYTYKK